MAFNISALDNYVEQNRMPLYSKIVAKADSIKYMKSMLNVKNVSNLNLIDVEAIIQDRACGWNPSGDTTFTARPMVVRRAQIQEQFCIRDLETTWMNERIKARVNGDEAFADGEIAEIILDKIAEKTKLQIDKDLWTATSAVTGFDGLLTIAESESATTQVSVGSGATVYEKVLAVFNALPETVQDAAHIFMSKGNFNALVQELITKGLYHPDFNAINGKGEDKTIKLPGFDVEIHGVSGLIGHSEIFGASLDNLFYGCDAEGDAESLESFYDRGDKYWKVSADFNYGAQIAFPDLVRYVA